MRFLIDEDVPLKLLRTLRSAGHQVERVEQSTPDRVIAHQAEAEGRILVTLDHDFTNTHLFPPSRLTIVHIQIHPPYAEEIVKSFGRLLATIPESELRGLIILHKASVIRVTE